MLRTFLFIATIICITACQPNDEKIGESLFINHSLDFSNQLQNTTSLNILNYLYFYNGAGTALGDLNNDGFLDIYLTSNQGADHLYINKGNLEFDNTHAFAKATSEHTTGVTMVDINQDGLLDIYVSYVSGHLHLKGKNKLYVNQGVQNGELSFKERAASFGLDLSGLFTQAAFFDYDLDGDLDVYLLKHSVHPNSNYNRGATRYTSDPENGDVLLENIDGMYTDVSTKAGILQNKISYGLGLSTGDINNDGYPDIYVGNDFFENDYLYINQQDGTFKEINTSDNTLKHTTHFSMGNDITDLNNDGLADILSVDMLPEDLETLKAAGTEYAYPIYQNQLRNGYGPQYMQNTLHLNQGNSHFSETAFQSGIAATEWSWSPLAIDFDNDGYKDIFITNGIAGATNDMDFVNFISNEEIQKRLGSGMLEEDLNLIKQLPEKKTPNYFYKNNGDNTFMDVTETWHSKTPSLSNGAAYGDLDNDGDVDVVVNNVNASAQLLENHTSQQDSSGYLRIRFKGAAKNTFGIGAKVIAYTENEQQVFENYTTRGYLSAVAPEVHIGLGKYDKIDSLKVIWPGGSYQTLTDIKTNQAITLNQTNTSGSFYKTPVKEDPSFLTAITAPITFKHNDGNSIEFNRDPLIPYASTNLGPQIQAGDLNNDGLEDIITLGAKGQLTTIHLQQVDSSFKETTLPHAKDHAIHEDVKTIIFDANGDSINDLLIVSAGNEFKTGKQLEPRLYIFENGGLRFRESAFKNINLNASSVQAIDLDNDGDLDLSISANIVPHEFGKTPQQYLFENNGSGNFTDISNTFGQELQGIGNVYDIVWEDLDRNGYPDAIIAGHWMPISILLNDGKRLRLQNTTLSETNGWWNTIEVADFDKDGDLDIIAGNWGLNTRLTASPEEPIKVYRNDFDDNGKIDPIVTYYYKGEETTIATKDELVKQVPYINKEFLSYNAFAKADINQLFSASKLKNAETKEVYELASTYFENKGNGNYTAHKLPFTVQSSTVMDILIDDFNNDNYLDALLVGNNYEISTQLGRLDGSQGTLLLNDTEGFFTIVKEQKFNISGAARSIAKLDINGKTHYIVGRNNDSPIVLKKAQE